MYDHVIRTNDYSVFKQMEGNREVSETRVRKIKESIEENGYIFSPIVCNEKMEIVDGQGRCEALKRLKMPVDYIVHPGLSVKDCIVMNRYQTKWTATDYIDSNAQLGNKNYINLGKLLERYKKLPLRVCISACVDTVGMDTRKITNGQFECSDETYKQAVKILEYAEMFTPAMKTMNKGNVAYMYTAIIFVYKHIPTVDKNKLHENFVKYCNSDISETFVNVLGALKSLNAMYNFRSRDRAYFEKEYIEHCHKMNASYSERYNKTRSI